MRLFLLAAAGCCLAAAIAPAQAATRAPLAGIAADVVPVAEGCGWGRWRGSWGGCRGSGWVGPGPYAPPPAWGGNGCPPGFWRGPWGHCRDTPFHGALPGGGWK